MIPPIPTKILLPLPPLHGDRNLGAHLLQFTVHVLSSEPNLVEWAFEHSGLNFEETGFSVYVHRSQRERRIFSALRVRMPDADLMADAQLRELRRQRFAADAKRAPPPLPKREFAHPEKLVKSDADAVLAKFLARKVATGATLTDLQKRALGSIDSIRINQPVPSPKEITVSKRSELEPASPAPVAPALASPVAADQPRRLLTLRKKLREIADLERREAEEGAVLQANQRAKIQQKSALEAELASLVTE